MSGALRNKHKGIPSFIRKTIDILQDPTNKHIACWSSDGKGFSILQQQAFSQEILPRYFKHSNYSSFVRQLNMYNFHKIRDGGDQSYFYHEQFQRDNIKEICEIRRKPERKKRKCRDGDSEEECTKPKMLVSLRSKDEFTKASEENKSSYQCLGRAAAEDQISIEQEVEEPILAQPAFGTRELMCPSRDNIYFMVHHSEPTSVYSLTNLIR